MSSRADIIDGSQAIGRKYGLIYTEKCGWVDLGHANPEGALTLWNQIKNEESIEAENIPNGFFRIAYRQMMGRKNLVMVGIQKQYDIKKELSESEKMSVALSIFLDVSHAFENLQASFPFNLVTDSGFSGEDLVSDLIGFYRAVKPGGNYIRLCQPVRKDIALKIWDTYGPVGNNKNHSTSPYLYPIPPNTGGITRGLLPSFLNIIKPVKEGKLYQVVH